MFHEHFPACKGRSDLKISCTYANGIFLAPLFTFAFEVSFLFVSRAKLEEKTQSYINKICLLITMICIQNNVFNSTNEEIINSISTCDSFTSGNLYSPQQEVLEALKMKVARSKNYQVLPCWIKNQYKNSCLILRLTLLKNKWILRIWINNIIRRFSTIN